MMDASDHYEIIVRQELIGAIAKLTTKRRVVTGGAGGRTCASVALDKKSIAAVVDVAFRDAWMP